MIEKVQETHLYLWLSERDSCFLGQLDEIIRYANDMLPLINNVFTNYTVHGIKHSINVMEYMYALITDIGKLSELEVTLLIYSALLHDIGMLASENEIKEIGRTMLFWVTENTAGYWKNMGKKKLPCRNAYVPFMENAPRNSSKHRWTKKCFFFRGLRLCRFARKSD